MDIDKVEKLLANIAKHGDKETIKNIIALLEEVSTFKVKLNKPALQQEAHIVDENYSISRAALILEDDKPRNSIRNLKPSPGVPYTTNNSSISLTSHTEKTRGAFGGEVPADMSSHADLLL